MNREFFFGKSSAHRGTPKIELSGYRLGAGQDASYRRPFRFDPSLESGGLPRTVPDARGSKYRLFFWCSDDLLLLRNQ